MPPLQAQIREYRQQQRGEYRLSKHTLRKPLGVPYVQNRVVVVGNDFAQLYREHYYIPETRKLSSAEQRRKRRVTEARRLEWGLKK